MEESVASLEEIYLRPPRRRRIGPIHAMLLAAGVLGLSGCLTIAEDGRSASTESESESVGWKGAGGSDPRDIAEGRRIAQRECSTCHAIDQSSASPNPGAPPFRDLLFLNDPALIAYRLIDSVRMGHDSMPLYDFDVRSADALNAYIGSINQTADKPNR
jgi:hypothetical protein